MTLPYSQSERVTTMKRVTVAEPSTQTVLTSTPVGISDGSMTYRTVNMAGSQLQPFQYINNQVDGNMMYGGARYLVPVQQRPSESYMYVRQAPRVMQQVYVQNVQPVSVSSVSSVDETDTYRQIVSVHSYFLLFLLCYICIQMLHITIIYLINIWYSQCNCLQGSR